MTGPAPQQVLRESALGVTWKQHWKRPFTALRVSVQGSCLPVSVGSGQAGGAGAAVPGPHEAWTPDATRGHFGGLYLSLALRMVGLKDSSKDLWSLKLWARYLARCGLRRLRPSPGASGGPSWAGPRGARLLPSLGVGTAEPCAGRRLGATGLCPFWML